MPKTRQASLSARHRSQLNGLCIFHKKRNSNVWIEDVMFRKNVEKRNDAHTCEWPKRCQKN